MKISIWECEKIKINNIVEMSNQKKIEHFLKENTKEESFFLDVAERKWKIIIGWMVFVFNNESISVTQFSVYFLYFFYWCIYFIWIGF